MGQSQDSDGQWLERVCVCSKNHNRWFFAGSFRKVAKYSDPSDGRILLFWRSFGFRSDGVKGGFCFLVFLGFAARKKSLTSFRNKIKTFDHPSRCLATQLKPSIYIYIWMWRIFFFFFFSWSLLARDWQPSKSFLFLFFDFYFFGEILPVKKQLPWWELAPRLISLNDYPGNFFTKTISLTRLLKWKKSTVLFFLLVSQESEPKG